MLHNPGLNERSECRLGLVMAARLTDAVPRRGTMREARNDEVHACNTFLIEHVLGHVLPVLCYYASKMHSASPRLAISIFGCCTNPPVCVRFAHLDWGYERFRISEAGCIKSSVGHPKLQSLS